MAMISRIEALNFRCLRYVSQEVGPFHVLVGPNASGKTTFLDVVAFLGAVISRGLEEAVHERTGNFQDLVWKREAPRFELAVEASIPQDVRSHLEKPSFDRVRYEVAIGGEPDSGEIVFLAENLRLLPPTVEEDSHGVGWNGRDLLFPMEPAHKDSVLLPKRKTGIRTIVSKTMKGNDSFHDETGKGWDHSFKLGPRKSALANLPDDESRFPVSTWFKRLLQGGVQSFVLNSLLIRRASPPGQTRLLKPDGSNLPWVVENMRAQSPQAFQSWIDHLRTALPDLVGIRTVERPDDKHRYLILCYEGGLEVPSWTASDGTLRLLALTLPAYLKGFSGVYLIEEPENGIHPRAVETMFQSVSSVYSAQILMATHSPVILTLVEPSKVLCFAKTESGATDIVSGDRHPALQDWRGETSLGTLFAAGVLS